jgi:hypothetical protein
VQDLVRAGQVEVRQSREEQHSDVHDAIVALEACGSNDRNTLFSAT